jgi:phospholysine phosphohistidine inorganic pyrophosphate phosphatase
MNTLLFDMDGVLYEGDTALPGARETIAWCRNQGIPHRFLTNTTSRPRRVLVEKLAAMDIDVTVEEILTPPLAATGWLQQHIEGPVALFVPENTREEFTGIDLAGADSTQVAAVVLGDLGSAWDFPTYNRIFRLLMDNPEAPLVALGLTRYWQAEDGLRLDVGPFVKGLEYATGREAVVMGKPAAPFFETALAQLKATAEQTLMIGDDIRGDIDGAQRAGINAVLVRSGKFRPSDLAQGITPYAVLDSVAALPAWWCGQGW